MRSVARLLAGSIVVRASIARVSLTLLALALVLAASPEVSADYTDPAGDFLASYTGLHGGDLDVISADVLYNPFAQTFTFSGTMNDAIGTTAGAFYVFGVNRGQGSTPFASIGAGNVIFDAVVVLRLDSGNVRDLISGVNTQILSASDIHISGATISATISAAALVPRGFSEDHYTWNLWPRLAGGINKISDFAPDNSNVVVRSIPEPMSLAMLGTGALGIVGYARRRKAKTA